MQTMNVEKRYSIGLPEGPGTTSPSAAQHNFQSGISKSMSGTSASNNYLKNTLKDTTHKTGGILSKDGTAGSGTHNNDILKATSLTPITDSFSYETFARIEQLLESSKSILEEFERTVRVNTVSTGAGGAAGEGKGVDKINHASQLNSQRSSMTKIADEKVNNQHVAQAKAASIEPQITTRGQTIGMTQAATNTNSATKQATNQRAQEKWEQQQQQQQG